MNGEVKMDGKFQMFNAVLPSFPGKFQKPVNPGFVGNQQPQATLMALITLNDSLITMAMQTTSQRLNPGLKKPLG